MQVQRGPRPAGSAASRRLAEALRARLPGGRFEAVPGGLRNVVGALPGRRPAILIAAHYDTKDIPGFVGANDGAGGTATVLELARILARGRPRDPVEVRFALFDGEESPRATSARAFARSGLRGSKAYAAAHARELRAMVLVDFVGQRPLALAREQGSDRALWERLRAAAARAGARDAFPARQAGEVYDDHTAFERAGVPAIDLVDLAYPCLHRLCDDLAHVSAQSLRKAGGAVAGLVRELEAER
jgi:Iap family predicted aminopeptidase